MALDNPLWQYALELYARPGVREAALALQEAGASINRLLLACYLATQGLELDAALLAGPAQDWQREITHPLRALRYRVREHKLTRAELDACYQRLREAELAAEQVELMLLWEQIERQALQPGPVGAALARRNLQRVLSRLPVQAQVSCAPQLEIMVAAAFASAAGP